LCFAGRSSAQTTTAATQPAATQPAKVAIEVTTEDKDRIIRATVTAQGKPVENATVSFFVCRTFGNLKLGEDKTLDDGTAAVKFPLGLPGGPDGQLNLIALVSSPPYTGASAEIASPGGIIVQSDPDPFPRALWSPHVPLWLLIAIGGLLAGVWSTYAFVVSQIIAIRKGARS
jgi:hypothetical protein